MKAILLLASLAATATLLGANVENLPALKVGSGIGSEVYSNVRVITRDCRAGLGARRASTFQWGVVLGFSIRWRVGHLPLRALCIATRKWW